MKLYRKTQPEVYRRQSYGNSWWHAMDLERNRIHVRFIGFTKRLPPPIRKSAMDMRTYLGSSARPHRALWITDCMPVITVLPFVLHSCFPVESESLRTLAHALTLLGLYSMAEDKLIDSQVDPVLTQRLLATSLYGEFLATLHELFPPQSEFWPCYYQFLGEHQMAEIESQKQTNLFGRTQERRYCNVVMAKAAPIKLVVCAMGILSGRREYVAQLLKSFDSWIVGYQLHDDVVDWKEDYLARRQSLIVTRIAHLVSGDPNECPLRDLERVVYSSDVIESSLEESGRWFARAEKSAQGIHCDDWVHFIRDFTDVTGTAIRNLVTHKTRILFGTA